MARLAKMENIAEGKQSICKWPKFTHKFYNRRECGCHEQSDVV